MDPNPYAPPLAPIEGDSRHEPVDRAQREELGALIRQFLGEELTAFQFDDQLDSFRSSADSAVRFVAQAVWYHYDDCRDHLVKLSPAEWGLFQRYLLLLASDHGVRESRRRCWSATQLVALFAWLGFVALVWQYGWGVPVLLAVIPCGLISLTLAKRRRPKPASPYRAILYPFASFADLKGAYVGTPFRKTRFPQHIKQRPIRPRWLDALHRLYFHVVWIIFSPVVLPFQMLPVVESQTQTMALK